MNVCTVITIALIYSKYFTDRETFWLSSRTAYNSYLTQTNDIPVWNLMIIIDTYS